MTMTIVDRKRLREALTIVGARDVGPVVVNKRAQQLVIIAFDRPSVQYPSRCAAIVAECN
jgi:hypothetical protein